MKLQSKLAILADAAKYDASCASSGAAPRNSVGGRGMGSTEGMGICHSYAPDGRCISLLKILLTNFCQYDCLYCVNRVTSNVPRARFTHAILPPYASAAMREALPAFGRKIRGYDMPDAVLTGLETRTSSPIHIRRGDDLQSLNLRGLYPAGEGAGYAGGILSAAVDGIRVGEAVAQAVLGQPMPLENA